ncbi:MAG TPA: ATP-binding protein [Thermoanaerobaculia bacterium]|nr:ATP-binding protein [Thermoanaerobaculia bacterium]
MLESGDRLEERVLILAPTGRDAVLAGQVLTAANISSRPCADQAELFREVEAGAGAALLAEEALNPWTVNGLLQVLSGEGPWSDLPLILFARGGQTSEDILERLGPLGNATILERPVRLSTLLSTVKAALRARQRQYEVRDLLRRQAEADRRKDEFLAMLGHELRNPLAAIRNALYVQKEIGEQDEHVVRQREVIQRQTRHLARMVDDLLDVSRVTLGKIILKRQPVDLADVAGRCLHELGMRSLADDHGLDLAVRTEPTPVEGDPVRLEQIVCNLLQNAIKYTPRGGSITVTVAPEDRYGVVRVTDTGVGLSPEMLTKVFEPFTQVESSRKRSEGGLGLGLPLVKKLIELHGGNVEAWSNGPERGSEFVVRLPLLKEEKKIRAALSRPPQKAAVSPASSRKGLHVLIVEDNPDGRESLRDLLEIWGCRVELAETGPEGVEKACALRPDIALVDIGLPGMDGNEVARRIRAVLDRDQIALVAMTGYGQPEDRRRAFQAGFDRYLVKPVDPTVLSQLLAEVREKSEARLEPPQTMAAAG